MDVLEHPVVEERLGQLGPWPQSAAHFLHTAMYYSMMAQSRLHRRPMKWPQALGWPSSATTGKRVFAVCPIVCRVLFIGHMAKKLLTVCTHGKNITHGKVYFFWHTAKPYYAMCFFLTHGKYMICRVFYLGTRQSKKISYHLETFYTLLIQYVVFHIKIWHILVFVCYI